MNGIQRSLYILKW